MNIKKNDECEFICKHCNIFLDKEDLVNNACPNCKTNEFLFLNDLLDEVDFE